MSVFFFAKIIECKLSGMIEKNERLLKCWWTIDAFVDVAAVGLL